MTPDGPVIVPPPHEKVSVEKSSLKPARVWLVSVLNSKTKLSESTVLPGGTVEPQCVAVEPLAES